MHKPYQVLIVALSVLFVVVSLVEGQGDCPALVQTALSQMGNNCSSLDRNTACYGYTQVKATFSDTQPTDFFTKPADRTQLRTLQTIETAPLDTQTGQWGIAVMNVQANVPDTVPGQAVTFLLMGDVQMQNAVSADQAFEPTAAPITVKTLTQSNVRTSPNANANLLGSVTAGVELVADGLNPGKDWVRVLLNGTPGWISRDLVDAGGGNLDTLPVISRQNRSPMQAFYFTTGVGTPACKESPPSALVVQGPQKVNVNITANGADITIGSTIVLQSDGKHMQLTTLVGSAQVNGLNILAGFTASAPVTQGQAGAWEHLRPMTSAEIDSFQPLENISGTVLHYPITVPTAADIQKTIQAVNSAQSKPSTNTAAPGTTGVALTGPAAQQVDCSDLAAAGPSGGVPYGTVGFFWTPAAGATTYKVNFFNSAGGYITSREVDASQTSVSVDTGSLGGDPNMTWEVEARVGTQNACTTGRVSIQRSLPPQPPKPKSCPTSAPC